MGRRSIAEKICSSIEVGDPRPRKLKLVVYDFVGEKIPPKFFDNLKRVFKFMHDGLMLQYSAIASRLLSTVLAVKELAKYYGCRSVKVFAVQELT